MDGELIHTSLLSEVVKENVLELEHRIGCWGRLSCIFDQVFPSYWYRWCWCLKINEKPNLPTVIDILRFAGWNRVLFLRNYIYCERACDSAFSYDGKLHSRFFSKIDCSRGRGSPQLGISLGSSITVSWESSLTIFLWIHKKPLQYLERELVPPSVSLIASDACSISSR